MGYLSSFLSSGVLSFSEMVFVSPTRTVIFLSDIAGSATVKEYESVPFVTVVFPFFFAVIFPFFAAFATVLSLLVQPVPPGEKT